MIHNHWINRFLFKYIRKVAIEYFITHNIMFIHSPTLCPYYRYYYDGDMISKVQGKRFVYKFVCDLRTLIGYSAAELNTLVTECEQKKLARVQLHGFGQAANTVTLATATGQPVTTVTLAAAALEKDC